MSEVAKVCQNCRHWSEYPTSINRGRRKGFCERREMWTGEDDTFPEDGMVGHSHDGQGPIVTGPLFGCIHFEEKPSMTPA